MDASGRRDEIMRIMTVLRRRTMRELASETGVTDRTIRNDITYLMTLYPLETIRGNGGCVTLPDWYKPRKRVFTLKQVKALNGPLKHADPEQAEAVNELLEAFA